MVKGFLEEHTQRKIQILSKAIPSNLFVHANKEQIEKKYGGTAVDLQGIYWYDIIAFLLQISFTLFQASYLSFF